jgi:ribosomal protein S18 acetylase RimI-like enzyme
MSSATTTVARRPVAPHDENFLRELFADSRPDLAVLPPDLRGALIDMQFRAQRAQYTASYPSARYEIIVADGNPLGQLVLDEGVESVRIVDVSVHRAHRGRGIASAVLHDVIARAERSGHRVCLSVWSTNTQARRLYGRLGFVRTDNSHPSAVGYVEMQHDMTRQELT